MHLQSSIPLGAEAVHAGVLPDVGPVASVLAELDVIAMRRLADFGDPDQLVLGPVQAAHPAIGFDPDAEVDWRQSERPTGVLKLAQMRPVHERVDQGTVDTMRGSQPEGDSRRTRRLGGYATSPRLHAPRPADVRLRLLAVVFGLRRDSQVPQFPVKT